MALGGNPVSIDIGSHSVKVAVVSESRGRVRAIRCAEQPLPPGYRWEVGGDRRPVVEAVRRALARAGIRSRAAIFALPRRQVTARISAFPPVDRSELRRVVQYDVGDHIPFPVDQVVVDFQPLGPSRDQPGLRDVLVVAAQRELVREYLALARDLRLRVVALTVDALALDDLAGLAGDGPPGLTIVLEVGHRAATINVSEGNRLRLTRSVAFGGYQLTQAIRDDLGVDWEEAEHIKRTEGLHILSRDPRPPRTAAWLENFYGEVRRSALSAGPAAVSRVLVAGAGAAVPGLTEALAEGLGKRPIRLSVRQLFPLAAVVGAGAEEAEHCLLAIGQALRGAGRSGWTISLIPPEVTQARRSLTARRVGLAAALAVVGLGVAGYFVTARGLDRQAAEVARLEAEAKKAREIQAAGNALLERRDALQQQWDALSVTQARRFMVLELLRTMSLYGPADVTITQFTLRPGQPLEIRGSAPTLASAADLQAALTTSPLLTQVALERAETTQATATSKEEVVFTLRAQLWTEKKPRPESAAAGAAPPPSRRRGGGDEAL